MQSNNKMLGAVANSTSRPTDSHNRLQPLKESNLSVLAPESNLTAEPPPKRLAKYRSNSKWRNLMATSKEDLKSRQLSKDLPARLDSEHVAQVLGFRAQDIPILVKAGLLVPLGNPVLNSVKFFAAMQLERLAASVDWLDAATIEIGEYWQAINSRRKIHA